MTIRGGCSLTTIGPRGNFKKVSSIAQRDQMLLANFKYAVDQNRLRPEFRQTPEAAVRCAPSSSRPAISRRSWCRNRRRSHPRRHRLRRHRLRRSATTIRRTIVTIIGLSIIVGRNIITGRTTIGAISIRAAGTMTGRMIGTGAPGGRRTTTATACGRRGRPAGPGPACSTGNGAGQRAPMRMSTSVAHHRRGGRNHADDQRPRHRPQRRRLPQRRLPQLWQQQLWRQQLWQEQLRQQQ